MKAILAIDANYGIGYKNSLPWPKAEDDLLWFRNNTRHGVVLMGRKTWESLGSVALPNRVNLVVSSSGNKDYFTSVEAAVLHAEQTHPDKQLWAIGGADIYTQTIPLCTHIYLTKFHEEYLCDTYLNKNLLKDFIRLVDDKKGNNCSFSIWGKF